MWYLIVLITDLCHLPYSYIFLRLLYLPIIPYFEIEYLVPRTSNLRNSTVFYIYTYSVVAKLRYMGYFASLLHPPGRKSWLLFSVRDMSGGLRNPCFTKFSVVNFL